MTSDGFTPTKVGSKKEWGALKRHAVVLPSGAEVEIEIPSLPDLIQGGEIPNNLIDTAIEVASGKKLTREHISEQAEFYRHLVLVTVKTPEGLTAEDLKPGGCVPFEDVEMLAEIATRQRDVDALGNHIAGLHKSESWRRFRGLDTLD